MSAPTFEFVDEVTSDLRFVASGATLGDAFAAAADALLEATVEDPGTVAAAERRPLALSEPHVELLLLAFLNELVYLRDAERLLLRAREVRVDAGPDGARLSAELEGERLDPRRHRLRADVKAATAHGLSLVPAPGGYRATVTLDV